MSDELENAEIVEPVAATPEPTAEEVDEALRAVTRDLSTAAAKAHQFPTTPGVYLMKDGQGRVIYVGKAKNLRARAGSYFLRAAAADHRTAAMVRDICDADFLPCESEVDALLMESRLIKDIQPRFNKEQK